MSPRSIILSKLWQVPASGKTNVPVKPMHSVHARFKHVVGVPAMDERRAVPYNKLRYLDNLIDRLLKIREVSVDQFPAARVSTLGSPKSSVLGSLSSANPLGRTAPPVNRFGGTGPSAPSPLGRSFAGGNPVSLPGGLIDISI